jgi:hypothetical protein
MTGGRLAVGDRVTLRPTDSDPIEISLHRHAVITAVHEAQEGAAGPMYTLGHPGWSERRYGPYSEARLIRGWNTP